MTKPWCGRFLMVAVVVLAACGPTPGNNGGGDDMPMPDAPVGSPIDAPIGTAGVAPGGACSCDADCADDGGNDGVCIYGVCMTKASGACASGGSQTECPTGSRCWSLDGSDVGPLCWPDCSAHTCSGSCDGDGSCAPTAQTSCDLTCGSACACTDNLQCGTGNRCVTGECVPDVMTGGGPGPGPGPACPGLPARDCTDGTCGQLVAFSPRTNAAWDDYEINGEGASQYRSYLRKDLMMLVGYASSVTACKAAAWTTGNGGALGLGDMSEANGAIPGTAVGSPGHPAGTHVNGRDIDLAYYQAGTANNRLRPICAYTSNGADQYHCVAPPTTLDVWRTALFLGTVFESPRTRVIGVDGQVGPLLLSALDQLCTDGWLTQAACTNAVLAYETTNMGQGWYLHHHHHAHISLKASSTFVSDDDHCYAPGGCTRDTTRGSKGVPHLPNGLHRVRAR